LGLVDFLLGGLGAADCQEQQEAERRKATHRSKYSSSA
jgi:hypothetical protein